MGRRALRAGDLVRPNTAGTLGLYKSVDDNNGDVSVPEFKLGMLICKAYVQWGMERVGVKVLVLDCQTGSYGWCNIKWLQRIK